MSLFSKLPLDVFLIIVHELNFKDIGALVVVDKDTHANIGSREWFWKSMFWNVHHVLPSMVDSWGNLFKTRRTRWYPLVEPELFAPECHNEYIHGVTDRSGFRLYYNRDRGPFGNDNKKGNWYLSSRNLNPIPLLIEDRKVLYFEIQVENEQTGDSGNGLGLILSGASLNDHMPGWEKGTYGMHSDDGNAYYNNDDSIYKCKSFAFGPPYQKDGIVVGCGYNFKTREIFYTHDGQFIGVAFTLPPEVEDTGISPCVGMSSSRSSWKINLGWYPFKFNIDKYICGDDIEKLDFIDYNEIDDMSQYRITRKEIQEMLAKGQNFLVPFKKEPTEAQ